MQPEVKTFLIRVPIVSASGFRVYEVPAQSADEALRIAPGGDWKCREECIEETSLEWEEAEVENGE